MIRLALAAPLALLTFAAAFGQPASTTQTPLTLEQIMADPDWIAGQIQVPEEFEEAGGAPYFGVDGRSVYYRLKRSGSPVFDLHRIDLAAGKGFIRASRGLRSGFARHASTASNANVASQCSPM